MKTSVVQESFAAGEVSPLVKARYSSAGYTSGCDSLLNMFPDSHGPARSRMGTKLFTTTVDAAATDNGRVIIVQASRDVFFTMVFFNFVVEIYKNDGTLQTIATPYTLAQSQEIRYATDPSGIETYLFHVDVPTRKLTYTPGTGLFALSTVTFTSPPAEWGANNWPSFGEFFEGRLWVGGTANEPETFWASVPGSYEDFTIGILASDAFVVTMSRQGRVEWLYGAKNLLVGTTNSENVITSSDGAAVYSANILIRQQSAYGSMTLQAQQVGDQVFYVSPDKIKLRALQYEWTKDNWLSAELTYFSEHITQAGVKRMAWQQNPYNLFWILLEDGTFATLSYDRPNNVFGWSRHNIGTPVLDLQIGRFEGRDIMMALTNRTGSRLLLEELDTNELVYVDAWVLQTGSGFTTVTGLDHLEGEEVQVLGDGAVVPPQTVSGGQITLPDPVDEAYVGKQFDATITLLPIERDSQAGSSAPYQKNFYRLFAHIIDSGLPLINGVRPPTRNPATPMDTAEPYKTEKGLINLTGWDNVTNITLTQDLPVPFTLAAVSGYIAQESL